jgi:hypothetical protein
MSKKVLWSEEAAARLRQHFEDDIPEFIAETEAWVDANFPLMPRDLTVNDCLVSTLLAEGVVELCPDCGQFKTAGLRCDGGHDP